MMVPVTSGAGGSSPLQYGNGGAGITTASLSGAAGNPGINLGGGGGGAAGPVNGSGALSGGFGTSGFVLVEW
jgi:hypothetical protein